MSEANEYKPNVVFIHKPREPLTITLDLDALLWDDFVTIQKASELKDQVVATEQILATVSKVTDADLKKLPMPVLTELMSEVMSHFRESGNPKN
ncbi:MAG: hypothetical protein U0350_39990 [Caldilineaceae bacterium]